MKNPKTFNEKLQWLKLYDRNPKYINMVDKYTAKLIVSGCIGEQYVVPTIGIYDCFDDIDFDILPDKFLIKCTHDSGGVFICTDKSKLNIKTLKNKIQKHLKKNYYYHAREWPYKDVKPRIIVEEYLFNRDNSPLVDYKFMCFNGKVKCSFVCSNRYKKEGLNVDFFDLNWEKLPFERHYKNSNDIIPKPNNYEKMISLAEKLSIGIPFLRIDFYDVNGEIYFGEFTFSPGAGFEEFSPDSWDRKLGDWIHLSC
ncbi:glycosyl transferase [Odoribacter sp. OttesenSCG-928-A06]|nr:glycosyl transferase [Odoribacter sp. OttesenSCG-928-A06]